MEELRRGQPVSANLADDLLTAARDLLDAVKSEKENTMREIRANGGAERARADWFRYNLAEKHAKILLAGAYRLIEARVVEDVSLPPLEADANGVTIEKALAYMHENNLYFNPADLNGQVAYHKIFEMMTRYYIDLCMLKNMEEGAAALRAEENRLSQIMLGERPDNLQRTAQSLAWARTGKALVDTLKTDPF
jgi:hypothetical protein